MLAAAAAQLLLYGSYSVWWGGYTYGPRYLLDLLPPLVPAAALAMSRIATGHYAVRTAAAAALAWSIVTSATGAFCYPHDSHCEIPDFLFQRIENGVECLEFCLHDTLRPSLKILRQYERCMSNKRPPPLASRCRDDLGEENSLREWMLGRHR